MQRKNKQKKGKSTLDIDKLKKECELGYFNIEDLFTKDQIKKANDNLQKVFFCSTPKEAKQLSESSFVPYITLTYYNSNMELQKTEKIKYSE